MSIFEIISAIVLIIACVFIVVVVLLKDTKTQMSQTISGTAGDSFFQQNKGRTKEAMLNKATIAAVIIFFVMAIAVNIINVYWGGDNSGNSNIGSYIDNSSSSGSSNSDTESSSGESSSEESSADTENSSDTESGSDNSESSDSGESGSSDSSAQSDAG